ncbi:MAG: NADH-quinone oxidoreductase subunit NuoG [Alphaproteobacteria bacterium]|nr:NADH-quinone oxidoreductase subunit NuoG [Alphaproteobacteria bacterium]
MPKLRIDDQEIEVLEGMTVLQAAELLGIEIPVFCYHRKLSIAGNCRMCLVEMEKSNKPIASCAMPASEGMVIHTQTPMVKKARQGVLEFLLINHPLDCPICDQGGECDLQDITMAYGSDASRFNLNKRAVPDKDFGPLIETAMNRCIHCTRCIRFANEIAGVPELGAVGRGEMMEITTYVQKTITSELSGNMIDICPVGALTSKPYSFRGRSWELSNTPSVDVMDGVGSAIRVDVRGREVMRILPRQNDAVNEDWISDKIRFAYDGLKYQRLDRPYVRGKDRHLHSVSWEEAFGKIAEHLQDIPGDHMAAIVGDMVDAEAIIALKDLMAMIGSSHIECRQDGARTLSSPRCSYLFNTTIAGIEQADFCLLIGTNPRWEAPLVNARIRKSYLLTGLPVVSVGPFHELGYPVNHLGDDPLILERILKGRHPICTQLQNSKHPMMILGQGALRREDGQSILFLARQMAEKYAFVQTTKPQLLEHWNGFNVLQTTASRVGALDLGFIPSRTGYGLKEIMESISQKKIKAVYLLGADEIDMELLKSAFIIYQGHHGDRGAAVADVILPGAAFTEKPGTYVNIEGRVQRALKAASPPGEAKEDWKIIRALSEKLGLELPYNTLEEVRARLVEVNPLFDELDTVQRAPWQEFGEKSDIHAVPFKSVIENFYMTDSISRHSITMAKCSLEILGGQKRANVDG